MQQRYCIEVAYCGSKYHGSQSQINANTIQSELEKALQIFYKQTFSLIGASRTDKGVHALQNFYHVDTAININHKQVYNINSILPPDISIVNIYKTLPDFHARFDALNREYKYFIHQFKDPFLNDRSWYFPYKISSSILNDYASIILEAKDFTFFSKKGTMTQTSLCNIEKSLWNFDGKNIIYNVSANRFLRGMVRGLTATMLNCARKKMPVIDFENLIQAKNNQKADFSAPSNGLYLCAINYHHHSFQDL
ncbi:MAG: tRNA pseudouridine(38-40) synthase TruA [Bacteroidetes bacterium]|nr:tRNA pseudouridine(38-40) synthase TruA [Bacteroidota bacterium]